ncbi:MAG: hypothetical protein WD231_05810 [Candidatus Woykebacteria bacterium]
MDPGWIALPVVIYEVGALIGAHRFWALEGDSRSRSNLLFLMATFLIVGQLSAIIYLLMVVVLALKAIYIVLINGLIWVLYWRSLWAEGTPFGGGVTKGQVHSQARRNWQGVVGYFRYIFPKPVGTPIL